MFSQPAHPTLAKAHLAFGEGILRIRFAENAVIGVEDVIYIYCYGFDRAGQKPYAILFDSSSNHELSEDAVVYLGNTALSNNIVAVAYISETMLSRIRLSLFLIFERPPVRPKIFQQEAPALAWLREQLLANQ